MGIATRLQAAQEKLGGRLKTGTGKLLGNPRLQLEGRAETLMGAAKLGFTKTLGWTRGMMQSLLGGVAKTTGAVTDSADLQAAGALKQTEGETRQTLNH